MLIWDRIWMASVGVACIGLGLVAKDFRWGLSRTGPTAPAWVGRLWFVGLGVALVVASILIHSS